MKLTQYVDHRYQELRLKESTLPQTELNVWIDSEMKAIQNVLTAWRALFRWIHYLLFPFGYFLVQVGLRAKPQPVILQMIEKQTAAEAAKAEEQKAQIEKAGAGKGFKTKAKNVTN